MLPSAMRPFAKLLRRNHVSKTFGGHAAPDHSGQLTANVNEALISLNLFLIIVSVLLAYYWCNAKRRVSGAIASISLRDDMIGL